MIYISDIQKFIEGVKHLISEAIRKAPYDKTYRGKITNITGDTCSVKINGIIYDDTPSLAGGLSTGDYVKVVFPQNNAALRCILNSGNGGGGISDAPSDGQQYARQDNEWTVVQNAWTSEEIDLLEDVLGYIDYTNPQGAVKAAELIAKLRGEALTFYGVVTDETLALLGTAPVSVDGTTLVLPVLPTISVVDETLNI